MSLEICNKEKCTGCSACYSVCPTNSITMKEEEETGFFYPSIEDDTCVVCGKCKKVCPVNNPPIFYAPHKTYAAWAKDDFEHETSTSGGIASVISRYILQCGGIVYGAAFDDDFNLKHIRIDNEDDIFKLKGSKYLQSNTSFSIKNIAKDINLGKKVLFIGTPCQVAGVKNLFNNSENLLTIDIVCHGVPSNKIFKIYTNEVVKNDISHINKVTFRDSDGFRIKFMENDRVIYDMKSTDDLYYMGFLNGLFFRNSCYSCRFASGNRVADITLGDFWGLGKKEPFNYKVKNGVSLCMINTNSGNEIFSLIDEKIIYDIRSNDEAIEGNAQLKKPFKLHRNKNKFFKELLKTKSVIESCKKFLRKERIKYFIAKFIYR